LAPGDDFVADRHHQDAGRYGSETSSPFRDPE
jgi:hypothetical protein